MADACTAAGLGALIDDGNLDCPMCASRIFIDEFLDWLWLTGAILTGTELAGLDVIGTGLLCFGGGGGC